MAMPARRACSGFSGRNRSPSRWMVPASAWQAPLRIFMSVLLPAPFSPISACTSPAPVAKETFLRAHVAPKLFRTPAICKRGAVTGGELSSSCGSRSSGGGKSANILRASRRRLFQILVQGGVKQYLYLGLVGIFGRDEHDAGIDALLHFPPLQMIEQSHHAFITHIDWVLHD